MDVVKVGGKGSCLVYIFYLTVRIQSYGLIPVLIRRPINMKSNLVKNKIIISKYSIEKYIYFYYSLTQDSRLI